ncbi:Ubiquitin-conjugating enzyme E2 [Lachnellula hyalina]|uniref:Ubiquitin-conjugating enzyme E2 n=1 Tax=Lachnellula hyalina TaxID=1316788 RepID=A0A8H8R8G1_9HELO|nr:Ubiquitin-conjugating enzyme E2 [Lachnellula hyalina]TVY28714.1 Ubiquitin-conjugating enzyme E2 [Lachnellula hyalina]
MASRAANKRLTREYKTISENPPPYIVAHPSESNILEWHYILTGPPDTPYHNGQYWGTLIFPPNYPFAPPAIRMHTPSGRFQPSTRLCLSISDFHPKSFNPAWEVSTILIGLLSFMTSEEMTTGSVGASEVERKWAANRSRWWNSTGGGSWKGEGVKVQKGNVKAGDGGAKFRAEWEDLDKENWKWIKENKIDPATGIAIIDPEDVAASGSCGPTIGGLRRPSGSVPVVGTVVEGGREGGSWIGRNKFKVAGGVIFVYVLIARLLGNGTEGGA